MHDAPVAEGDAAQALRERARGQVVQLRQGVADLDVALLNLEARGVRVAEVLWRADMRTQRRTERKLSRDILHQVRHRQVDPSTAWPCRVSHMVLSARGQACVHGWGLPTMLTTAQQHFGSPVTSLD